MRLREIMSGPVSVAAPDDPAEVVWNRMRTENLHHLVVRSARELVGIVSSRDLGGPGGKAARKNLAVSEFMTADVVTATPETTVRQAANLLRGRSIGCLPVLEGTRLVGMVTVSDLLELLGKGAERPVPTSTRWTLRDRGPRHQKEVRP